MTDHGKPGQNAGNQTTVHSPKAPGEVEKVDPQTGVTSTESTNPAPNTNR